MALDVALDFGAVFFCAVAVRGLRWWMILADLPGVGDFPAGVDGAEATGFAGAV